MQRRHTYLVSIQEYRYKNVQDTDKIDTVICAQYMGLSQAPPQATGPPVGWLPLCWVHTLIQCAMVGQPGSFTLEGAWAWQLSENATSFSNISGEGANETVEVTML